MKKYTPLMFVCVLVTLVGCGQTNAQVLTRSTDPISTSPTSLAGPVAQNVPFRTERIPNSLLYEDLRVDMSVCVHRTEGSINESVGMKVSKLSDNNIKLVTLTDDMSTLQITASGYGLEAISDGQWANAWLTASTCSK